MIHHLTHRTTDCLAKYISNQHPLPHDEVVRLDSIDRANRKSLRAPGLRETHAPIPALRMPYVSPFALPTDDDALLEARPPVGPAVLCDERPPLSSRCAWLPKGDLPLVIIFAQGPRSVRDLPVHIEDFRSSRGEPFFAFMLTLRRRPALRTLACEITSHSGWI